MIYIARMSEEADLAATSSRDVSTTSVGLLLEGRHRSTDSDGQLVETSSGQHLLCVGVDFESVVGRKVQSRDFGNVLILALSLLFLQLERDTSNRSLLDSLHQIRGVTGNLQKHTDSKISH